MFCGVFLSKQNQYRLQIVMIADFHFFHSIIFRNVRVTEAVFSSLCRRRLVELEGSSWCGQVRREGGHGASPPALQQGQPRPGRTRRAQHQGEVRLRVRAGTSVVREQESRLQGTAVVVLRVYVCMASSPPIWCCEKIQFEQPVRKINCRCLEPVHSWADFILSASSSPILLFCLHILKRPAPTVILLTRMINY